MQMKKLTAVMILLAALVSYSYCANDVLIPLAGGKTMTCQFINNTGTYSNSQIYVLCYGQNSSNQMCYLDQTGNMVPLIAGQNLSSFSYPLRSFSGYQFPSTMISVRLYVSLGSPLSMNINPGTPVGVAAPDINNPSDPNINTPFDWIEFNLQNNTIFCNTSQVDMFGLPMVMTLYDNAAGGGYTVNGEVGITETAGAIMSEFASSVPSQFQNLETPVRIVAPIHGSFGSGGANANYLSSYIAGVWNQYKTSSCVIQMGGKTYSGTVNAGNQLAFTTAGDSNTYLVNYPSDQDVWQGAGTMAETTNLGNGQITSVELALEAIICASFHRHVIDNTANVNTPSAYYQTAPYDYYAQFWHIHSINGAAYGFCYDDVNTQSSTLVSTSPRGIVLAIGGGTYAAPTATPTPAPQPVWRVNAGGPQYTDTLGNIWAADEDYSGGTQASPTANTISGALPGAADQFLYQTQRYGNTFTYTFIVPAGSYQVTMKFAETYWTAAGDRVFNVSINGSQVLTNFDIFKDSGGENIADDRVYSNITPNAGGQIVIQFGPSSADNAMVNAIQIIPMPSANTPTSTFTATFTTTSSITSTWSATATITTSFTPSATSTIFLTATPTTTATFTGVGTSTTYPTQTYTSTTVNTNTRTPAETITSTSLNTATMTPTKTQTASGTRTYTDVPTGTTTRTPLATETVTGTSSATSILTFTGTPTDTPTYTSSPVPVISATTIVPPATATYTVTVVPALSSRTPVIYPNPSNGTAAVYMMVPLTAPADVTVEIFTVSYRKISSKTLKNVTPGMPVLISPINGGTVPASGLYYVLVEARGNKWVTNLLILH
jgi:hypothetical protein